MTNRLSSDMNPNLFNLIVDRNDCKPLWDRIHEFCDLLTKLPDDNNLKSDFFICVSEMLDEAEKNAFDKAAAFQFAITADEQQAQAES